MSANQNTINDLLSKIYNISHIEEINQIKYTNLNMLKSIYDKSVIINMINEFLMTKQISQANKDKINIYLNEIYELL